MNVQGTSLQGRRAVITGATAGIGKELAKALLGEGAQVVLNGRDPGRGQETLDWLDAGDRAVFVAGDVRSKDACYAAVDTCISEFGGIDILINNAGGTGAGKAAMLWEMEDEEWDSVIQWNLNSAMWASKRALPDMIDRGWGRIINMSSIYGKIAIATAAHYVTTKHGLIGLTKAVATETGTLGITCNAICPGFIRTETFEAQAPGTADALGMSFDDFVDSITANSMTKQVNQASQVAAMTLLLCSEAGDGITGAALNIDGGTSPY